MLRNFVERLEGFDTLLSVMELELLPLLKRLDEVAGIKETEVGEQLRRARRSLRENRRVVVAVVGQVKSGKSTLLNGLLFEGRPQLPTAATPMTARLTLIRSNGEDERPGATVHFYTVEDWADIRARALQEKRDKGAHVVYSHIVEAVERKLGGMVQGLLGSTRLVGLSELEDYVAEHGTYTDAVKFTELRFPDMPFEELQVVDTPGLNDPVRSREAQTLEFLRTADAVVFLSSPHRFLDSEDMKLVLRDMVRSGVSEVLVVVPQMDTLDPAQREDFVKNCLGEMSLRATNFAKESGFGPMAQELAAKVFVPENTVMISAMAHMLALHLARNEPLTEDEDWVLNHLMRRNGWPVDDHEQLEAHSNVEALVAMIDSSITKRKGKILLTGPVQKIAASVNEIAAQNERRLAETVDDMARIRCDVETHQREREAELKAFEEFSDHAEAKLAVFQRRILAHPEWTTLALAPPVVTVVPWFSHESEENGLAEEIVLKAEEVLREKCSELQRHYRAGVEDLQDSLAELLPSLKNQNALFREINTLLNTLTDTLTLVLGETRIDIQVNFSYGFWQRLIGQAKDTATADVARACRRAEREISEAIRMMQTKCNAALVESVERLRGRLQSMRGEKQRKLDELDRRILEGETAMERLGAKYQQQISLFEEIGRVVAKVNESFESLKHITAIGSP